MLSASVYAEECPSFKSKEEAIKFVATKTGGETIQNILETHFYNTGLKLLLVGSMCGNGGCDVAVFKEMQGNRFVFQGMAPLNLSAYQFMNDSSGEQIQFLTYWHSDGANGILSRHIQNDCDKFREIFRLKGGSELSRFVTTIPSVELFDSNPDLL